MTARLELSLDEIISDPDAWHAQARCLAHRGRDGEWGPQRRLRQILRRISSTISDLLPSQSPPAPRTTPDTPPLDQSPPRDQPRWVSVC
jgi:hypothetical protein